MLSIISNNLKESEYLAFFSCYIGKNKFKLKCKVLNAFLFLASYIAGDILLIIDADKS